MAQKFNRVRRGMADKDTLEVFFEIDSDEDRDVVDNTEVRTSEDEVPPQVCKNKANKRHLGTKRAAYWPPSEVTKHVKEKTLPERHTWTLHDRILGSRDDDSQRGQKERKRKRNKLWHDTSEEEEADYLSSRLVYPVAPLSDPLQSQMANSHLYPQANALTTRILAPEYEHPNDRVDSLQVVQDETDLKTAAEKGSIQGVSNETLVRHVLKQEIELKLMLKEAKKLLIHLTALMSKDQPSPAREAHLAVPQDLILPVRTQQELLELERCLGDDSFHELLIKSLSCVGGTNTKNCVKRIMQRILTDKVARNYNWKGQKGEKCAFKGLKVQTMICKAVRKNNGCTEASDDVIEGAIKEWLRFAAERDGGRKQREEKKRLNDEYLVARQAVDNSQYTSALDTTDDDSQGGQKERKRKRNKLWRDNSEEEEADYLSSRSVHPVAPLSDPLQPKMANNHLYPQANALTTRILAPKCEHPSDQRVDSLQVVQDETDFKTAAEEGSIQEVSNEALVQYILKQEIELKLMLQEAKDMLIPLTTLMSKDQPAPAREAHLVVPPPDLILPVRTQQELLELEGHLDDDSFHELLIKSLSCVGGTNTKNCVKRIMQRILTDKVARNYNWKGQKGEKCAFKGLKVQTMICKAVRKNNGCTEASDDVIEGAIKEWLRFAAERDGGRKQREEKKRLNGRMFHGGDTCVSELCEFS